MSEVLDKHIIGNTAGLQYRWMVPY